MGKKKDKLYKLEPETKAMIAAVRSAVEDCAATGLYGRFMGFEESHTTDDYRLPCSTAANTGCGCGICPR